MWVPSIRAGLTGAISRGGGQTDITLLADFDVVEDVFLRSGAMSIRGGASRFTLRFDASIASANVDGNLVCPRIIPSFWGNFLRLDNLTIELGTSATALFRNHALASNPVGGYFVYQCELVVPPSADQALFGRSAGLCFPVGGLITGPEMAGHWVEGVAADTDPATVPEILYTNLGAL